MNDWRKPCEHGFYFNDCSAFADNGTEMCPGGSPVTAADLEGEKVWWCERDLTVVGVPGCLGHSYVSEVCGWRLLIPIPDPVAAE